ncbi:hypothetical protein N7451_007561 [Penicillium sp. IBT 35674x]|nr:hypothetical protein N7451_007561 [Penicillium sp. IBT 35674x]
MRRAPRNLSEGGCSVMTMIDASGCRVNKDTGLVKERGIGREDVSSKEVKPLELMRALIDVFPLYETSISQRPPEQQ